MRSTGILLSVASLNPPQQSPHAQQMRHQHLGQPSREGSRQPSHDRSPRPVNPAYQRYLYPLEQSRDAAALLVPSRVFPWVGFGFGLWALLICPLLGFIALAGADAYEIRAGAIAFLGVLAVLEVITLGWIAVHIGRLIRLRMRLLRSTERIVPPPPSYLHDVSTADQRFYDRDDRVALVRWLCVGQAAAGRVIDFLGSIGPDSWQSPGLIDDDGKIFRAAKAPRTAFTTSMIWFSLLWAISTLFILIGRPDGLSDLPAAGWAHLVLTVLLLAAGWTTSGLRFSLDRQIRLRIAWTKKFSGSGHSD